MLTKEENEWFDWIEKHVGEQTPDQRHIGGLGTLVANCNPDQSRRVVASFYHPNELLAPTERQTMKQANADAYLSELSRTQFTRFIKRLRELDDYLRRQRRSLDYLQEQRRFLKSVCTSLSPLAARHGGWIDVREEMPPSFASVVWPDNPDYDNGVSVEVLVWHGMMGLGTHHRSLQGFPSQWLIDGHGYRRSQYVTHWMPVAAPPMGVEL